MTKKPARISTFGSQATSVISVALTLVILGILALSALAADSLTDSVRRSLTLTVKAVPEAKDVALSRIKRMLNDNQAVASYTFQSADQVLASELEFIGEDVSSLLDENPYSAEFDVHLKPSWARPDSIAAFTRIITADEAVDKVITDASVVEAVNHTFHKLTIALIAVATALLFISFVLINNTVSLSIYSRRFLIRTMKLVGATPGFIRRPFVRAGLVNGLIAAAIACAILAAAQAWAVNADADAAQLLSWTDAAIVYAGIFVAGAVICSLAAWCAATRYLRLNYDSLYRK